MCVLYQNKLKLKPRSALCVQITAPVWAGGTQRDPTNGSVLLSLCADNGACLGWRDAEGPYQWLRAALSVCR